MRSVNYTVNLTQVVTAVSHVGVSQYKADTIIERTREEREGIEGNQTKSIFFFYNKTRTNAVSGILFNGVYSEREITRRFSEVEIWFWNRLEEICWWFGFSRPWAANRSDYSVSERLSSVFQLLRVSGSSVSVDWGLTWWGTVQKMTILVEGRSYCWFFELLAASFMLFVLTSDLNRQVTEAMSCMQSCGRRAQGRWLTFRGLEKEYSTSRKDTWNKWVYWSLFRMLHSFVNFGNFLLWMALFVASCKYFSCYFCV